MSSRPTSKCFFHRGLNTPLYQGIIQCAFENLSKRWEHMTATKRLFFTVVLALAVSACSDPKPVTIRADDAQIGAGATITFNEQGGQFSMGQTPRYPQGLKQAIDDVTPDVNKLSPTGEHMEIYRLRDWKMELTFQVVGSMYVCTSCLYMDLPLTWHKVK